MNDLKNVNEIIKFAGADQDGLKLKGVGFIKKGQDWVKKKEALGWRDTVMGWLSPEDIKEAGLVFSNQLESISKEGRETGKARGYDSIPSEEYICEDSTFGTRGSKYIGPSRQFLDWYSKKYNKKYEDKNESYINKLIKTPPQSTTEMMF